MSFPKAVHSRYSDWQRGATNPTTNQSYFYLHPPGTSSGERIQKVRHLLNKYPELKGTPTIPIFRRPAGSRHVSDIVPNTGDFIQRIQSVIEKAVQKAQKIDATKWEERWAVLSPCFDRLIETFQPGKTVLSELKNAYNEYFSTARSLSHERDYAGLRIKKLIAQSTTTENLERDKAHIDRLLDQVKSSRLRRQELIQMMRHHDNQFLLNLGHGYLKGLNSRDKGLTRLLEETGVWGYIKTVLKSDAKLHELQRHIIRRPERYVDLLPDDSSAMRELFKDNPEVRKARDALNAAKQMSKDLQSTLESLKAKLNAKTLELEACLRAEAENADWPDDIVEESHAFNEAQVEAPVVETTTPRVENDPPV